MKQSLQDRIVGEVCNVITARELVVPAGTADIALCMFVLSAIAPEVTDFTIAILCCVVNSVCVDILCFFVFKFHEDVIKKIVKTLKPGGKLLIRDYGRYKIFFRNDLLCSSIVVITESFCL